MQIEEKKKLNRDMNIGEQIETSPEIHKILATCTFTMEFFFFFSFFISQWKLIKHLGSRRQATKEKENSKQTRL
jgi:hypothetical protein